MVVIYLGQCYLACRALKPRWFAVAGGKYAGISFRLSKIRSVSMNRTSYTKPFYYLQAPVKNAPFCKYSMLDFQPGMSFLQVRSLLASSIHNVVAITFIDRNGERILVKAQLEDNLLDVAKDNDIDGVEGACGGTLSCSTCHCIFSRADFDRLGLSNISEEELDMLDLAYGLSETSRLVCSINVRKEMDGIVITVPVSNYDARLLEK